MSGYQPVIGLEIHVELSTKSKMFCLCSADYFGKEPNTHTCPVCLGLPGAMPKANTKAVEYTHMLGLALNCQIPLSSKFDRKNYFYPDLAKGFQISQYDLPFSQKGFLEIETDEIKKKINVTRAHLEEDTGKLTHATIDGRRVSLIDFNRSGVPLVEVVSEPEVNSSEEAKAYAQKLQQIVRYLKISDADMEKGSMRIEPNVSLRKKGEKNLPNYKVELKNINSFRFAQAAIEYEIKRQSEILDQKGTPTQETRGWNESKNETFSQRTKELAHDYRYFPEPDLPPLEFDQLSINKMKKQLPELPEEKLTRFQKVFQLSKYDGQILTRERELADYFEEAIRAGEKVNLSAKQIANVIINKKPDIGIILPAQLVQNILLQTQVSDVSEEELAEIIDQVLMGNQKALEDYKKGKENVIMFLIGQVMRKYHSKVDAEKIKTLLIKRINSDG